MQDQCHIACFRCGWISAARHVRAQLERSGRLCVIDSHTDNGKVQLLGGLCGGAFVAGHQDNRLRAQILKVKLKLLLPIRRVQRRRYGRLSYGDKRCGHLWPVGKDNRHTIPSSDTSLIQRGRHAAGKRAQTAIGEPITTGRADCGCAVIMAGDEFFDGL